jgi:hypothetical protein
VEKSGHWLEQLIVVLFFFKVVDIGDVHEVRGVVFGKEREWVLRGRPFRLLGTGGTKTLAIRESGWSNRLLVRFVGKDGFVEVDVGGNHNFVSARIPEAVSFGSGFVTDKDHR